MKTYMVISIIGEDRPGLVELLAKLIRQHDGNWLESRMANLSGKFAGIIRIAIPAANVQAFSSTLAELDTFGIRRAVEITDAPQPHPEHSVFRLDVIGHDRPGIVQEVASALAARGINVMEFDSEITNAAMSGEPLFQAEAILHVPSSNDIDSLCEKLDLIADELLLEYTLEEKD